MPSISFSSLGGADRWVDSVVSSIQARQIPDAAGGPPFTFSDPTDAANVYTGPYDRSGSREGGDGVNLSPGILGALIVSVLAFFALITGLCAYRDHQWRKSAKKLEAAMKENPSVIGSVAGTVEPPPPYDAVHLPYRHPAAVHQWDRPRGISDGEEGIELHPTVTNGMEPGRQSQRR
ncbi:hypothetical protein MFIFM68171_08746 [Madurella fahalii]|uniref:Transmembrane protein n=1 Tax=Madurella fahalii TaxID=1157608 RepID=A0ABQ0GLD5_9PEZI